MGIQELQALLAVTEEGELHDALTHLIATLSDPSGKFNNIASPGLTTSIQPTPSTTNSVGRARRSPKPIEFENLKNLQALSMSEAEFLVAEAQDNQKTWLSFFW